MNEKKTIISLTLSTVAICISVVAIVLCLVQRADGKAGVLKTDDVQYVLYLGVDDKNTDEPVYSHDDAKNLLEEILPGAWADIPSWKPKAGGSVMTTWSIRVIRSSYT